MTQENLTTQKDRLGLPNLTPSLVNALFSLTGAVGNAVSGRPAPEFDAYESGAVEELDPPVVASNHVQALGSSVLVRTPSRLTPVTKLKAGDFVCTEKLGFQRVVEVREQLAWMTEDSALIRISAEAFGNPSTAWVTGDQKLIFSHDKFVDLYGAPSIAIKAIDLVNGRSVLIEERGLPLHVFEIGVEQASALVSDGLSYSVQGRARGHYRWPTLSGRDAKLALRVLGYEKGLAN